MDETWNLENISTSLIYKDGQNRFPCEKYFLNSNLLTLLIKNLTNFVVLFFDIEFIQNNKFEWKISDFS